MDNHVHVDRAGWETATELLDRFGEHALIEAASRASQSRSIGNVIHFCRWRQIERAIELLSSAEPTGRLN